MYFELEPTGCCERKGMVQVRFSFYLEPGDYGYEKHYVQVPEIPEGGYPETIDISGPESEKAFNEWINALPKKWQNNPFHNHFYYYHSNVTEEQIREGGRRLLSDAFAFWEKDQLPNIKNSKINWPKNPGEKKVACESKVSSLTSNRIWGR